MSKSIGGYAQPTEAPDSRDRTILERLENLEVRFNNLEAQHYQFIEWSMTEIHRLSRIVGIEPLGFNPDSPVRGSLR